MAFRKKDEDREIDKLISSFNYLSKDDKIELILHFVNELKRQHSISEQEIFGNMLTSIPVFRWEKEAAVPVGIFANDSLSSLEAIVKYLREELKLRFSKIAKLLNRSNKTIWATYNNATKKTNMSFGLISKDIMIPASAISNRSYSTLESVVAFIKDLDYSNHEVAQMLHLDDSTIWTIYDRVKKKRGMKA